MDDRTEPRPSPEFACPPGGAAGPSTASLALAAARSYAACGLPVVPLPPASKIPLLRHWAIRASRLDGRLRRWFPAGTDRNVGIVLGRGGVFALDLDADEAGVCYAPELRRAAEATATAHALTGSGGHHFLFRLGPDLRVQSRSGVRRGVDIIGHGGLLVVEPSTHPETGREYVWLRHPIQGIAAAPAWLVALLDEHGLIQRPRPGRPDGEAGRSPLVHLPRATGRPAGPVDRDALLAELIGRFPIRAVGERNDQMRRVVASLLGRGLTPEAVADVAGAWNDHFHALGRVRTRPEACHQTIRQTIASLARKLGTEAFPTAGDAAWHEAACRAIRLDEEQLRLLGLRIATLAALAEGQPGAQAQPQARPGPVDRSPPHSEEEEQLLPIDKRLCETDTKYAFVESLVVHATHELGSSADGLVRLTNDQIRRLVAGPPGGLALNPERVGDPTNPALDHPRASCPLPRIPCFARWDPDQSG